MTTENRAQKKEKEKGKAAKSRVCKISTDQINFVENFIQF